MPLARSQAHVQDDLTSIFLGVLEAGFGTTTFRTPLERVALIWSASTPDGSWNEREKDQPGL